jgi:hypothetical protein
MLTIRPTLMLARRLGIDVPRTPPPVANRVADWCAHQFNVSRTRYLIFCHTVSLYPVITYARGVVDEESLIKRADRNVAAGPDRHGAGISIPTLDRSGVD